MKPRANELSALHATGGQCSGSAGAIRFRPAAFVAAERASSFGLTFHSMIEDVYAGPIHSPRRFPLETASDEETISITADGI